MTSMCSVHSSTTLSIAFMLIHKLLVLKILEETKAVRGRPELSTLSREYTEYSFLGPPPSLPKAYFENVDFETPSQNGNAP